MDQPPPQHLAPMAYSIPDACIVAGVGRSRMYEAIASGALRARKNGTKNLILRDDLLRWLESLPTAESPAVPSKRHQLARAKSKRRLIAAE
jgi:excisionase family DNA binding protein